jgi:hypothetical protein
MDDADAELQDRIDKRSAGIILRTAIKLRSTSLLPRNTYLRSSKGVRDTGGLKEFRIWNIEIRRLRNHGSQRYIIGKFNFSTQGTIALANVYWL